MTHKTFSELASINVNEHTEKKGKFTYLSWAWAVDFLLRNDPTATWRYEAPVLWGETVMVFCSVTAFGVTRTAQLPVMDNQNRAISNPDAMDVNKAMQRCLAKAIALHGLGLYIYNGEDLPSEDEETAEERKKAAAAELAETINRIESLAQAQGYDIPAFLERVKSPSLKDLAPAQIKALEAKLKGAENA